MDRQTVHPSARTVCERLQNAGHEAHVVGGCVRDALLGRPTSDWDVATSASPEIVQRMFPRTAPTGIKHGTVTVLVGGEAIEVTTFRAESGYSDGRHPDHVVFGVTLEEDLSRRDFTINAMAYDPIAGTLFDPYLGQSDLAAKILRAVGVPEDRFREDSLRVLRAVRLCATLEFALDPATEAGIAKALHLLGHVSAERVRVELIKLLAARQPSLGLRIAERTGVLAVILPELAEMVGVSQNRYHRYDVWEHTLATVDATDGDALCRLGALLHDVGKPRTRAPVDSGTLEGSRTPREGLGRASLGSRPRDPSRSEAGVWGEGERSEQLTPSKIDGESSFYNHDALGAEMADDILRRLKFSNEERERVVGVVQHHMFWYSDEWNDATVRRFVRRVQAERLADLFAVRRADVLARGFGEDPERELGPLCARIDKVLSEAQALSVKDLAIDGQKVMGTLGLAPGRKVGEILRALLERVIDDPSLNEAARLEALLPEIACSLGADRAEGDG